MITYDVFRLAGLLLSTEKLFLYSDKDLDGKLSEEEIRKELRRRGLTAYSDCSIKNLWTEIAKNANMGEKIRRDELETALHSLRESYTREQKIMSQKMRKLCESKVEDDMEEMTQLKVKAMNDKADAQVIKTIVTEWDTLQKAFEGIDANNDGKVSFLEFAAKVKASNDLVSDPSAIQRVWLNIAKNDANSLGREDFMCNTADLLLKRLHSGFDPSVLDLLQDLIEELKKSRQTFSKFLQEIDRNGDGKLTLMEFLKGMKKLHDSKIAESPFAAFQKLECNGSGFIRVHDLELLLLCTDCLSPGQIEKINERLAWRAPGRLDKNESQTVTKQPESVAVKIDENDRVAHEIKSSSGLAKDDQGAARTTTIFCCVCCKPED